VRITDFATFPFAVTFAFVDLDPFTPSSIVATSPSFTDRSSFIANRPYLIALEWLLSRPCLELVLQLVVKPLPD